MWRSRPDSAKRPRLERAIIAALVAVIIADVGVIAFGRADEQQPLPKERTATPTTSTSPVRERRTEPDGGRGTAATTQTSVPPPVAEPQEAESATDEQAGPPPCADVEVPTQPVEAVTCRTRNAKLTIFGEDEPLLLGDTHVRVHTAEGRGNRVIARVRVRNETNSEQGIQAGGQELYLNLKGIRVDPDSVREERLPPATGKTIDLRFSLTPGQRDVLNRLGRWAELGVRPWTEGEQARRVGVIRFLVRPASGAVADG